MKLRSLDPILNLILNPWFPLINPAICVFLHSLGGPFSLLNWIVQSNLNDGWGDLILFVMWLLIGAPD